jgi:hypothetical protein
MHCSRLLLGIQEVHKKACLMFSYDARPVT